MNSIILPKDDSFQPLPILNKNQQHVAMSIIANSGSGKSTFVSKFLKELKLVLTPEAEFYLLTNKKKGDEPAFKELSYLQYVAANDLSSPININKFTNATFLFDDIHEGVILDNDCKFVQLLENESAAKKRKMIIERQKQLDQIINQSSQNLLTLGRSRKLNNIIIKHQFRDGKSNVFKSETNSLVVFPSTNKAKIKEYLKNNEGLSKAQIELLFSLKESKGAYQFLYISRGIYEYAISNNNLVYLGID
jgi:adenylate kinase family enzyme